MGAMDWVEPSGYQSGFGFGRDTGTTVYGMIVVSLPAIIGS